MEVFEDEVIPFESINVDTTQRVIYSTRSISFEWIEDRLDPGDDDKSITLYIRVIKDTNVAWAQNGNKTHLKMRETTAS